MNPQKVAKRKNKAEKTLTDADSCKQDKEFTKQDQMSSSSISSNYSCDGSVEDCLGELEQKTVDIGAIAEVCVLEEMEQNNFHENNFSENIENFESVNFCTLTCDILPVMELTFEEEFRMHELEVMKEHLLNGFFKFLSDQPHFLEHLSKQLISLSLGLCTDQISDKILADREKMRNCIQEETVRGGKICKLLDSFYVFKNVPDEVRVETFQFSLSVVALCFRYPKLVIFFILFLFSRAFFKANSNKEYFIDQKRAAGLFNPAFEQIFDHIFSNNR